MHYTATLMLIVVAGLILINTVQAQCDPPSDYTLVEGFGKYKLHILFKTWHEAKVECENERSHLVIMNSQAEVAALESEFGYPLTWVGVTRELGPTDDDFVTVFGEPLSTTGYTMWYLGQPQGNYTSHPHLSVYDRSRGLYAQLANARINYLCECEL